MDIVKNYSASIIHIFYIFLQSHSAMVFRNRPTVHYAHLSTASEPIISRELPICEINYWTSPESPEYLNFLWALLFFSNCSFGFTSCALYQSRKKQMNEWIGFILYSKNILLLKYPLDYSTSAVPTLHWYLFSGLYFEWKLVIVKMDSPRVRRER